MPEPVTFSSEDKSTLETAVAKAFAKLLANAFVQTAVDVRESAVVGEFLGASALLLLLLSAHSQVMRLPAMCVGVAAGRETQQAPAAGMVAACGERNELATAPLLSSVDPFASLRNNLLES